MYTVTQKPPSPTHCTAPLRSAITLKCPKTNKLPAISTVGRQRVGRDEHPEEVH